MVVTPGSHVTIDFVARYPDGELFDTSIPEVAAEHGQADRRNHRPLVLEVGAEPAFDALQAALLGMDEGGEKAVRVPHEQLRYVYEREAFESMLGAPPEVGTKVETATGLVGTVVELGPDRVTVDFDPDRSGQTLTFEIEILDVAPPG